MKRYHACMCFLLSLMYCFVACGASGQISQPQAGSVEAVGAYVERDISPAGMDVVRYVVGPADMVAIDSSYGRVAYRQQAEGSWEYAEGWLANATGIDTILEATFLDRETMLVWAQLEDGVCCPIKLWQDGEWEIFSKALYEENAQRDGEYYHVGLLPLQDGTIVASAYILSDEESFTHTALYAANGEWLLDYEIGLPAMDVAQLDGALYMLNMWPELFTIGKGGERLEATGDTLLVEMGANVRIAADEEALALIGADGIYRLESDRSLTRILDGRGYSFGAHGNRVESFACMPGGYLVATDAGRLYEIRWDDSFEFEGVLRGSALLLKERSLCRFP